MTYFKSDSNKGMEYIFTIMVSTEQCEFITRACRGVSQAPPHNFHAGGYFEKSQRIDIICNILLNGGKYVLEYLFMMG